MSRWAPAATRAPPLHLRAAHDCSVNGTGPPVDAHQDRASHMPSPLDTHRLRLPATATPPLRSSTPWAAPPGRWGERMGGRDRPKAPPRGPCWLVAVPCMRSLSCIALQHAHTMPLLALLPSSYVMPDQRTVYGTDDGTNVRWGMEGWLVGTSPVCMCHTPAHLSRCSATDHIILAVQ